MLNLLCGCVNNVIYIVSSVFDAFDLAGIFWRAMFIAADIKIKAMTEHLCGSPISDSVWVATLAFFDETCKVISLLL